MNARTYDLDGANEMLELDRNGIVTQDNTPNTSLVATGIAAKSKVEYIPLDKIEIEIDDTFMFRANIRVADLKASIQQEGQQLPIVVRKVPKGRSGRYQVVSGFRRLKAIEELGGTTIAAIIRADLDDDEAAFRASIFGEHREADLLRH